MRVNRMLSMLLIISKKGMVTGKELAEHFEVSLRTIYRDIEKIAEAGIPIASIGGKGGGYYLMNQYRVDNLFLSNSEAGTMIELMNHLDILFGKNNQFNDIVLKFENTYKQNSQDRLSINMSHFSMEEELKNTLMLINEGISDNKLLEFDYINRNMEKQQRMVEPIQIAFSGGHWHLIAFCRVRDDYRRFKLVRIRHIKLGKSFLARDLTKQAINQIFDENYNNITLEVKLKFASRFGEHLIEHFSKESIQKNADGSYTISERYPDDEGLIKFILSFGKDCEVLEPLDLKERVKNYVTDLLNSYENSSS